LEDGEKEEDEEEIRKFKGEVNEVEESNKNFERGYDGKKENKCGNFMRRSVGKDDEN
jgi:hypothetical protein